MEKVLVVDDDPEIRTLLSDFLKNQGLKVFSAANGSEMWEALARDQVDLVVLDVMMPGSDGLTICRELRATSSVPIIIVSALDAETDCVVGLEIGADDYVVKPFSPRELLARMRAVFRRMTAEGADRSGASATNFIFCGFRFDARKRELRTPDDVIVHLSRSEFDLLFLFVKNPYELMDRNLISQHLRGHELSAFDRSVDLLVSRLRNKLSHLIDEEDFIKTVRGVGYMFSLDVETAA